MKKWMLWPCLLLACFGLTGCLGLVVAHPKQQANESFKLGRRGEPGTGCRVTGMTEEQSMTAWGLPDSMRKASGGTVVWHYDGKANYGLVIPMYLLPVPIPYPAGHDYVEIYFKDGIALNASRTVMVHSGASISLTQPGDFFDWEKDGYFDKPGN